MGSLLNFICEKSGEPNGLETCQEVLLQRNYFKNNHSNRIL